MKNSSRLLAEIDTKRSRSSNGWCLLPASSSTRMLNCSQLTSRLTKRAGLCRNAPASGPIASASANSVISFIGVVSEIECELAGIVSSAPQRKNLRGEGAGDGSAPHQRHPVEHPCERSEERRVGKEC